MTLLGIPEFRYSHWKRMDVMSSAVMDSLQGMKMDTLVQLWSVMVRIESKPLEMEFDDEVHGYYLKWFCFWVCGDGE